MGLGRQGDRQGDLVVTWKEMPRSPGHVFYDRLQAVLIDAGFDAFAETTCKPYYAAKMGAPSIPPGRYFRMHMVGYFEGIDSERGIELLGLAVAAGVSASADGGAGAGSLLVVEDAEPPAARGPREGVRLGPGTHRRARSGEGRADRRRRFDDGGQRRAQDDRPPGLGRDLSGDAEADGRGERHRDAVGRRSRSHRSHPARARSCPTRTG